MIIRNLKLISVLSLILLAMGCGQVNESKGRSPAPKKVSNKPDKKTTRISAQSWFDSIAVTYNKTTTNELVRNAMNDSTVKEEWNFDQIIKTDTANYFVYQVGHDVSDKDGVRFATDCWIYVDTVKRKLYEYQPDDKLLLWKAGEH